jgi:Bacterial PH domain
VDIIAIQKFVAAMVMENFEDAKKFSDDLGSSIGQVSSNAFSPMLDWLLDDGVPEDVNIYEQRLRSEPPILLSDERIISVFRSRRDKFIYTDKRLLLVDVKGWSGKKIMYLSIPNKWISTFSVETAGHLDNEGEAFIHTECSIGQVTQDVLVKKFDILKIHANLSQQMFFKG